MNVSSSTWGLYLWFLLVCFVFLCVAVVVVSPTPPPRPQLWSLSLELALVDQADSKLPEIHLPLSRIKGVCRHRPAHIWYFKNPWAAHHSNNGNAGEVRKYKWAFNLGKGTEIDSFVAIPECAYSLCREETS